MPPERIARPLPVGALAVALGLLFSSCDDGGPAADRRALTDAAPPAADAAPCDGCDGGLDGAPPDAARPADVGPDAAPADAAPPDAAVCTAGCEGPHHRRACTDAGPTYDPCPEGEWCREGVCFEPPCTGDGQCHSDTWCDTGWCVPYPAEPRGDRNDTCRVEIRVGEFAPEVQCRWRGGQVSGQPIAIDLDRDEIPEIVFVTAGRLVAIRGDDCSEVRRSDAGPLLSNESSIAAGDIDADGFPEVVAMGGVGQIFAFDHELGLQWVATTAVLALGSAPAIADLDGDGRPEVIAGASAFNGEDGSLHGQSPEPPLQGFGPIPAIADVDGDGQQEVLYGNRIYDSQMRDVTPDAMRVLGPGHVAVADFDPTSPGPELAVVGGTSRVRVQRLDGTVIFGPYAVPQSMWGGGAPNVADFDGDGLPEIGTAGSHFYAVFDLQCVGDPLPAGCEAEGIRWTRAVRDTSSGSTGSTTFDFEGDGRVEVVYNDECFLRVFDGTTGEVRLALANTTGTLIEAPIVLDVDGDYNSEIVVGSDTGFPCNEPDPYTGTLPQQTAGITVLRDVSDRWVHSRPIWNQNAYSITNVENDGTIPARPEANWERFNSFRQNAQPEDKALEAPDLTVGHAAAERAGCGAVTLTATVANRGAQPVSRGVRVAFLDAPPADGGVELCVTYTAERLAPGASEVVTCVWERPVERPAVIYAYVDFETRDGAPINPNAECVEGNNWTTVLVPGCP